MSNLYFPICAILINILLVVIFYGKGRVENPETKIYGKLIIIQLIESIIETTIYFLGYFYYNVELIKFLNNFVCIFYLLWCFFFFTYIYYIANISEKNTSKYTKLNAIGLYINIFVIAILFFAPITLVNENDMMYSYGIKITITYIMCFIWLLFTIVTAVLNYKKLRNKKFIPLLFLFIIIIIILMVRIYAPNLIIIPLSLSFINLIMYNTIENPDLKLINELEYARDAAQRANNAKSDFLSSMSHEIRTPLNAIVGLSEDIESYKERVPKEVLEDIIDIKNASQTLVEIVGNILDINKIESGKMELSNAPYHLKEEVEKLVSVTTTRIGEKPIAFKLNIASDIPYELVGDKVHIKEIINNLLTNAIKYTDKGNISLNINAINKGENCLLFISVEDTGHGIKKESINRLFSKFDRLDAEKNTTIEGTGLGLAITKNLVEMMGGKINVQSTFGSGSLFMVQIPQKISKLNAPVEESLVKKVESVSDYGQKRILLVDDNKLNIKVAKKALEPFHFDIVECENGVEALEKYEKEGPFDLILLDIMMPVMGGEETLKKLKENKKFNTPVLALTADAVEGAEEKYINLGFTDYLAKPFNKVQLKEKLDKVWKR